jgi:hypothetical protein
MGGEVFEGLASACPTQLKDFDFVQDLNHLWWDDNVRICELLVVDETMS